MSRESLVAALEEAGVGGQVYDRDTIIKAIAYDADLLLPILLAHASDEDFGAALEARGIPNDFHELLRRGIAFASPTTLTNALKTASPEAKAAALRGLLGERTNALLDKMYHAASGFEDGVWLFSDVQAKDVRELVGSLRTNRLLAPEAP